jgi:glycosidase
VTKAAAQHFPSPPDWRDVAIYQIFTDRFADGDPANNELTPGVAWDPTGSHSVHGGDFKGIEQRLDYIHALGARAIWITPVFLNEASSAWHGYGAVSFTAISPQLGGLDGLRRLIHAAHSRRMFVLIDVVVNHLGAVVTSDEPGWPKFRPTGEPYSLRWRSADLIPPPPFNNLNWFHDRGAIGDWSHPVERVVGQFFTLSDLRTELPEVRAALIEVYQRFIRETDCDGFRVDTVKHVERSFWAPWCAAMRDCARSLGKSNFLLFGEAADPSDKLLGSYTGPQPDDTGRAFDSLLDFPLYYAANDVFARRKAPTRRLTGRFASLTAPPYSREALTQMVTFIDNHDQPRFLAKENADGDIGRLRQALVFLYTASGIPCLYYGTEQGFHGGNDPFNREDMIRRTKSGMVTNHFQPAHPLYRFIARLHEIRASHASLRRGELTVLKDSPQGPGLFAFARRIGREWALVVFNTAEEPRVLALSRSPLPRGIRLQQVLGDATPVSVGSNGRIGRRSVPPGAAWILANATNER